MCLRTLFSKVPRDDSDTASHYQLVESLTTLDLHLVLVVLRLHVILYYLLTCSISVSGYTLQ